MDPAPIILSQGSLHGLKPVQAYLASHGIEAHIVRPPDSDPKG